jgi:ATP-dependent DNA helicase Q1
LSIVTKDVTLESWKILRVLDEVIRCGGRVTLANLADLVRGLGGGSFAVPAGGKRKRAEPEKASLNLEGLIGGKITMNKDVSGLIWRSPCP